ncbi:MAG: DoxX family membrane protein [Planctomycetes bacterium]|nr:DoxX family membrane protein [Planctomycetota bacterium]
MVTARGVVRWLREGLLPLLVARVAVGGVYVAYGVDKVREPAAFLKAIHGYDLLPASPPQLLNLTTIVLPWFEILCGCLLLLGAWRRTAATLLCGLTAFFTVVVTLRASALASAGGLSLCAVRFDCGCGGGEVWFCTKFAENCGLVLLAALAALSRNDRCSLGPARAVATAGKAP